ncbi:MAG: 50S ribosomal protein L3 N(5)-glutamine methyltransferase [Halioglobus sp.]
MTANSIFSEQTRTVGQAMQYCAEALKNSNVYFGHGTDNAWDEAAQLVLFIADLPADCGDEVLSQTLDNAQKIQLESLLHRRIREQLPLPYLLGRAWFAGLEFLCDQRAIIPRSPFAELILNEFQPWYSGPGPTRILDLCCGGGCIGLAVAHYFPEARVDLLDIDHAALELARENTRLLHLEDRVTVLHSDLFDALTTQTYDLILSNPPYVDEADLAAMPAEYHHEPELALGSGADGLDITRRILACARGFLRDSGLLLVEVGNSWPALEEAFPRVPFTWVEFEQGGEGVFMLTARELQEYSTNRVE